MRASFVLAGCLSLALLGTAPEAHAQPAPGADAPESLIPNEEGKVRINFEDVSITAIIDAIARLTGKNFIYDERVRGKITVISPSPVEVDEAWAVFESILKVKGFTAVPGPGGVLKIIPVRDAKESNIETIRDGRTSANRDQFVTRLIPLYYIDADSITATIKPLVSKEASMVVYSPTNTIILTDTKANIRRLLGILEALDVETHKEELTVIKILYADAGTLARQITDIYGGTASGGAKTAATARRERSSRRKSTATAAAKPSLQANKRGAVRIITEERTNSLLVMASRAQTEDIRALIRKLDVPVVGGGRIHVYYLKHADATEMAKTINGLLGGGGGGARGGRAGAAGGASQTQALRSVVTPLAEGSIKLNADPATNSLVIQASKEAFETLVQVIQKLDMSRPQVLVEALIMEVDITDSLELGFDILYQYANTDTQLVVNTANAAVAAGGAGPIMNIVQQLDGGDAGSLDINMYAAAGDDRINILSAPHILTSDNEEAEIRIGDNIPIITNRVQSATGATIAGLSTSVNVERRDIGVTLRVTPQISEGDTLRLKIYQEISEVNTALTQEVAGEDQSSVGVALSNRKVENTVVVADGQTVVIGGLIGEVGNMNVNKVPWLGDIPFLGWAFKAQTEQVRKLNLIIMLTPHIVRGPLDLEHETIRKRRQFVTQSGQSEQMDHIEADTLAGVEYIPGVSLVEDFLLDHRLRYPLERMSQIEEIRRDEALRVEQEREAELHGPRYMVYASLADEMRASSLLTEILDLGYEATLVSHDSDGVLIFELQIGAFGTLREAESASTVLRRSMDLEPTVVIIPYSERSDLGPEGDAGDRFDSGTHDDARVPN